MYPPPLRCRIGYDNTGIITQKHLFQQDSKTARRDLTPERLLQISSKMISKYNSYANILYHLWEQLTSCYSISPNNYRLLILYFFQHTLSRRSDAVCQKKSAAHYTTEFPQKTRDRKSTRLNSSH